MKITDGVRWHEQPENKFFGRFPKTENRDYYIWKIKQQARNTKTKIFREVQL